MRKRTGHTQRGQPGAPWLASPGGTGPPLADPAEADQYSRHSPRRWGRGPRGRGPLRRTRENRLLGGVASGLATRTGFDVTTIRLIFVVAALSGFGLAVYVLIWLLVPVTGEEGNIASRALTDRRGIALAAAACSLLIVVLLIGSVARIAWLGSVSWPLVISLAGLVLIYRNAPADEQAILRRLAEPVLRLSEKRGGSRLVVRVLIAAILLGGGLGALLAGDRNISAFRPLAGVALVIAAIVILLGPWWLRVARDLVVERQARARAEERADMAARVHDSVLQTLALIQRRSDDPQQVIQLARAQERELRSWLFDGQALGSLAADGLTLAAGVRLIQQEVEARHGIAVEAVTVGDCELDDDLNALLAAAREATVNAVKWSGAQVVSVFAEVEPAQVSVFVRDRGRGFDPDAVPADRKGLAESVRARMARRGGHATIRSVQGEGTEVSLTMPRSAGQRQPSRT